jgi:hypothetical protein
VLDGLEGRAFRHSLLVALLDLAWWLRRNDAERECSEPGYTGLLPLRQDRSHDTAARWRIVLVWCFRFALTAFVI